MKSIGIVSGSAWTWTFACSGSASRRSPIFIRAFDEFCFDTGKCDLVARSPREANRPPGVASITSKMAMPLLIC